MGTLSRDADAYQRALAIYQRRAGSYNRSIAQDANGNPYLIDKGNYSPESIYAMPNGQPQGLIKMANKSTGKVSQATNPPDFVGATDNGDPNFLLLRQNPRGYETKTLSGVQMNSAGQLYLPGQLDENNAASERPLDMNKVKVVGQPDENGNYTVEYQVPKFADKPNDFTMKAPDSSPAAVQRDQRPSVVSQEGGLIGEVLASRGLKSSGTFPGQREAINKARDDRAAAAKLAEEKAAAEKARAQAEEDAANAANGPT